LRRGPAVRGGQREKEKKIAAPGGWLGPEKKEEGLLRLRPGKKREMSAKRKKISER